MAHPVCWPSNPMFFPMGINAATSLTQDLSPEQSADILLLGCGDPRSILFTVSTDVTCPSGEYNVLSSIITKLTLPQLHENSISLVAT
jgi:hypothetical protein